mgnify:CR=1 FL=1
MGNSENRRRFIGKLGAGLVGTSFLDTEAFAEGTGEKSPMPDPKSQDFWKELRKQFPLRTNRVYFNNGTFGPAPFPVVDALKSSIDEIYTSGEYGNYKKERKILADFVGVRESEISLTHNTTEGINIMAWGIPLKSGDEVILSKHEHVGNGLPWLNRAKLDGIVLKTFEPKSTSEQNFEAIKKLVTPKTRVIAIPHVTCTTGLVFPVKEICDWAASKNIFTAIDGAHGAGTFDLNLEELGCDFYASCYHKWMLGPVGTGFLYVKEDKLDQLQAIQVGGYSDIGWDITAEPPTFEGYVSTAHRYDYGTQSRPQYVGAAAAAEFQQAIGKTRVEERLRELNNHLFLGLSEIGERIRILTPEEESSRISMISFQSKSLDYQTLAKELSRSGFRIRQVPESNVNAIRVSTHIYNSLDEIDRFVKTLEELV